VHTHGVLRPQAFVGPSVNATLMAYTVVLTGARVGPHASWAWFAFSIHEHIHPAHAPCTGSTARAFTARAQAEVRRLCATSGAPTGNPRRPVKYAVYLPLSTLLRTVRRALPMDSAHLAGSCKCARASARTLAWCSGGASYRRSGAYGFRCTCSISATCRRCAAWILQYAQRPLSVHGCSEDPEGCCSF
jgi:hypothetical protein